MSVRESKPRLHIITDDKQFLNSVLSSIDGGASPIPVPEIRRPTPVSKKSDDQPANSTIGGKRKAEDEIKRPNDKFPKPTIVRSEKPAISLTPSKPPLLKTKLVEGSSLHKGTDKPRMTTSPNTTVVTTSNPPKKGSYQEILARAKQAQVLQVGTITHKPKEPMSSKKQIAEQKRMALENKKEQKYPTSKSAPGSKSNSPAPGKPIGKSGFNNKLAGAKTYHGTSKPKPQPSSLSYQGTAKPKVQTGYKGTMKPTLPSSPQRKKSYDSEPEQIRPKNQTPSRRRGSYSEEDGDEEEDHYDYASEDYSDMDAGFDDVEEEDEKATRLAKREDAYEQMMLEEMKRQKEERKRRLTLAAEKEREMRRR